MVKKIIKEKREGKIQVIRECRTCEFNFDGKCAAGDGKKHKYGALIKNFNDSCVGWGADVDHFSDLISFAPWYIKLLYDRNSVSWEEFLNLIDADNIGEPIKINIFDAILKVYNITGDQLAEILGVKITVLARAFRQGVPEKRINSFSKILCIPPEFFEYFSSNDLGKLELCRQAFKEERK